MSEENVELVQRDIAARTATDWRELAEIRHPDIRSVTEHPTHCQALETAGLSE